MVQRSAKQYTRGHLLFVAAVCSSVFSGMSSAQSVGVLYLVEDSGPNTLYAVDVTTAAPTLVGAGNSGDTEGLALSATPDTLLYGVDGSEIVEINADGSGATVTTIDPAGDRGLTFNPNTGLLYGADNGTFESINPTSGAITALASVPGGEDVEGLATNAATNTIYGVGNDEVLYAYDVGTGSWSTIGSTAITNGNDIGLAYDPGVGLLYAVDSDGVLYTVDPSDGSTVVIGNTGLGSGLDVGLAFASDFTPQKVPLMPAWALVLLIGLIAAAASTLLRRERVA